MRIFCDSCRGPQPAGWKRGDFCVHCGQVSRREMRCYWCLHFTPEGKFCRKCAAPAVADQLFAAARMLKDAGVDRFTIAKQLAEMDPEQVETFTNIYQQHAGVMWRHVDQLITIQEHLVQRHWASELEEQLLPQLPWPDEKLDQLTLPHVELSGPEELQWIRERSPFLKTQRLAILALATLGDPKAAKAAYQEVYCSGDEPVREEALLTITHWRCFYGADSQGFARPTLPGSARQIVEELRASKFEKPKAARLAMLGVDPPAPELLDDKDPDVAFMAVLGSKQSDRLATAAGNGDELKRFAAALRLLDTGERLSAVGDALQRAEPEHQFRLLKHAVSGKRPLPELRRTLFELLAQTPHAPLRRLAGQALSRACQPHDAIDIMRLTDSDRDVIHWLLQQGSLPPETLREIGMSLVDSDSFASDQWGMDDIAKPDRMPLDFVTKAFISAGEKTRIQLLQFAEKQLKEADNEALQHFIITVAFGAHGPAPVPDAWCVLDRLAGRRGYPRKELAELSVDLADRCFGGIPGMIRALKSLLELPAEVLSHWAVRDRVSRLLRYTEDGIVRRITAHPGEALLLEQTLTRAASNRQIDQSLRVDFVLFLGAMAEDTTFRTRIRKTITLLRKSELEATADLALDRLSRLEVAN